MEDWWSGMWHFNDDKKTKNGNYDNLNFFSTTLSTVFNADLKFCRTFAHVMLHVEDICI